MTQDIMVRACIARPRGGDESPQWGVEVTVNDGFPMATPKRFDVYRHCERDAMALAKAFAALGCRVIFVDVVEDIHRVEG